MHFVKPELRSKLQLRCPILLCSPLSLPPSPRANNWYQRPHRSLPDGVNHTLPDRSQPHSSDRRGVRQADLIAGHQMGATLLCAGEVRRGLQRWVHNVHRGNLQRLHQPNRSLRVNNFRIHHPHRADHLRAHRPRGRVSSHMARWPGIRHARVRRLAPPDRVLRDRSGTLRRRRPRGSLAPLHPLGSRRPYRGGNSAGPPPRIRVSSEAPTCLRQHC
jgi:hypothetical protein